MIKLQVINQTLPAGVCDNNDEIFHSNGEDYAFKGGVRLRYDQFPETLYTKIDNTMALRTKALAALDDMGLKDLHLRRRQFIRCNNSSFDFVPDVCADVHTLNTEYVPCSIRRNCKYEGDLCQGVPVAHGTLSMRELEVMGSIRIGLYDKEICHKLDIRPDTLKTHKRNIQRKLGVERKSAIANSAATMQII